MVMINKPRFGTCDFERFSERMFVVSSIYKTGNDGSVSTKTAE